MSVIFPFTLLCTVTVLSKNYLVQTEVLVSATTTDPVYGRITGVTGLNTSWFTMQGFDTPTIKTFNLDLEDVGSVELLTIVFESSDNVRFAFWQVDGYSVYDQFPLIMHCGLCGCDVLKINMPGYSTESHLEFSVCPINVHGTMDPSDNPTKNPSSQPTANPSFKPSFDPTLYPTNNPSVIPTEMPSGNPSSNPTLYPTKIPSRDPTNIPSNEPSVNPSEFPSENPTHYPSQNPSNNPTNVPSLNPTENPNNDPSITPSVFPSFDPSITPTQHPSYFPSNQPTINPGMDPTITPSISPAKAPSILPTKNPTLTPVNYTIDPTIDPTYYPSNSPTERPSFHPSISPTIVALLQKNSNKDSLDALQIAMITIGFACAIIILVFLIFCCKNCKQKFKSKTNGNNLQTQQKLSETDNVLNKITSVEPLNNETKLYKDKGVTNHKIVKQMEMIRMQTASTTTSGWIMEDENNTTVGNDTTEKDDIDNIIENESSSSKGSELFEQNANKEGDNENITTTPQQPSNITPNGSDINYLSNNNQIENITLDSKTNDEKTLQVLNI